jgi:hypothetical protein
MEGKKEFWRQGDVGILKIDKIPETAKEIKHDGILAYGEVTGHKHQLVGGKVRYFMDSDHLDKMYFKVESRFVNLNHGLGNKPTVKKEEDAATTEEGHFTHELPQGDYELLRQKEFDWQSETTRAVED